MSATPKPGPVKKQFLLFFICMLAHAHAHSQPSQQTPLQQKNSALQFPDGRAYKNAALTNNIIDASDDTYGYNMFVDGPLMIHQMSIPAMPSNEGFKIKDEDVKVAEIVIYKIRKGEMPPTVSPGEMRDLGAIK